ncbi:MAG: single-stranded-DNA-specific exonuclease RecJ [Chitinophagales bacterium]|jgi:single-stranded-DNA-specific exonuclease|nr:single-stranded-DNA-specific exonuclease RecJ [Chitinophagales bacterium]
MSHNIKWVLKEFDKQKSSLLHSQLKINPIFCDLLIQRGIETYDQAKSFFRPSLNQLYDPFLMKDMDKAVSRIQQAILQGQKILIYGDYDVDGTTSVSLVYLFLKKIYSKLDFYIPDRHSEGYGISLQGIQYAQKEEASLIIALDCGITAIEQSKLCKTYGIDLIICDHHNPGPEIPDAYAILNPKQNDCSYPFKELSGCGVGYKLISGFAQKFDMDSFSHESLLDLVAVSIASDIVPIEDENRILAYFGLKKLNDNPSSGLKKIIENIGYSDKLITISNIVFSIGPRINAPGRVTHAKASVELLISEDEHANIGLYKDIDVQNESRRAADKQITSEAIELFDEKSLNHKSSIVLANKHWHKGVIGIVASRIVSRYYKPTIIFTESEPGFFAGSARSIKGFNIYEALKACQSHIFQFGGHDFAAGLTIKAENLKEFIVDFESYAAKHITDDIKFPKIELDACLELERIDDDFYKILVEFEPFGPKNMKPIFYTKMVKTTKKSYVIKDMHLKLELENQNGYKINAIFFNAAEDFPLETLENRWLHICFHLDKNQLRNEINVELMDIKFAT